MYKYLATMSLCGERDCGVPPKFPCSTKVLLPAARRQLAIAGVKPIGNFLWPKGATQPMLCPLLGQPKPKTG